MQTLSCWFLVVQLSQVRMISKLHSSRKNASNTGCLQARRCASSQTPGPGLEQRVIGCDLPLGKRLPFGNNDFQWFQNRKKERNNWCYKMAIGLSVALTRTISIVTFKPGSEQDQNPTGLLFSHPWLFFENIYIRLAGQEKFGWN